MSIGIAFMSHSLLATLQYSAQIETLLFMHILNKNTHGCTRLVADIKKVNFSVIVYSMLDLMESINIQFMCTDGPNAPAGVA